MQGRRRYAIVGGSFTPRGARYLQTSEYSVIVGHPERTCNRHAAEFSVPTAVRAGRGHPQLDDEGLNTGRGINGRACIFKLLLCRTILLQRLR